MPALDLTQRVPAGIGLVAVALAALVLVGRPAGDEDASAAAREPVEDRAKKGSVRVLIVERWGGGALTLTGFDDAKGRKLAFGFAIDRGRGWRSVASTERRAELTDVRVGSLLVTTSGGGAGQPAWSAVYGELGDARIRRVEAQWDEGPPTSAARQADAYLVVRPGIHTPVAARYLAGDGTEIAKVPIA